MMFHERLREYKRLAVDGNKTDMSSGLKSSNIVGLGRNEGAFGSLSETIFGSSSQSLDETNLPESMVEKDAERLEESGGASYNSQSLRSNSSSVKDEYVRNLRSIGGDSKRELIRREEGHDGCDRRMKRRIGEEDLFSFIENREGNNCGNLSSESRGEKERKFSGGNLERITTTHRYYDILDVKFGSSISEIRRSYRKKVTKHHPDKIKICGKDGDRLDIEQYRRECLERFQEIQEAYEILSDPNKRELYDEYGDEILKYGIFESLGELRKGMSITTESRDSGFEKELDTNKTRWKERAHCSVRSCDSHTELVESSQGRANRLMVNGDEAGCDHNSDIFDFKWEMHWQSLLMELFIVPVLRSGCLELRYVGGMNISARDYGVLVRNSQKYLRSSKNISEFLFRSPVNINLDNLVLETKLGLDSTNKADVFSSKKSSVEAGGRNSLYSRLTEKLNQNRIEKKNEDEENSGLAFRFNSVQVIGGSASVGDLDEIGDKLGYDGNKFSNLGLVTNGVKDFSLNNLSGLIFGESSEGWEELLKIARKHYNSENSCNKTSIYCGLKRKLKSIQNRYNWVILLFVTEECLPLSDQELLLELYNIEDTTVSSSSPSSCNNDKVNGEKKGQGREIIEYMTDFKSLSLFPCLILRPKNNFDGADSLNKTVSVSREGVVYKRPSRSQIEGINRVLEFVFQLDETSFSCLKGKI